MAERETTYVAAIAEGAKAILAEQENSFVAGEDVAAPAACSAPTAGCSTSSGRAG